jgi:RNA recognition motif. (a.k.a. RRM, RBD, or RNP domain)
MRYHLAARYARRVELRGYREQLLSTILSRWLDFRKMPSWSCGIARQDCEDLTAADAGWVFSGGDLKPDVRERLFGCFRKKLMKLYVGNLSFSTTEHELRDLFRKPNTVRTIPFLAAAKPAVPVYLCFFGLDWFQVALFLVMFCACGFSITLGYHRLCSHLTAINSSGLVTPFSEQSIPTPPCLKSLNRPERGRFPFSNAGISVVKKLNLG